MKIMHTKLAFLSFKNLADKNDSVSYTVGTNRYSVGRYLNTFYFWKKKKKKNRYSIRYTKYRLHYDFSKDLKIELQKLLENQQYWARN